MVASHSIANGRFSWAYEFETHASAPHRVSFNGHPLPVHFRPRVPAVEYLDANCTASAIKGSQLNGIVETCGAGVKDQVVEWKITNQKLVFMIKQVFFDYYLKKMDSFPALVIMKFQTGAGYKRQKK